MASAYGLRPIWATKGGFRTKKDALNYLPTLIEKAPTRAKKPPKLEAYWHMFEEGELQQLSYNKQSEYHTAWRRLEPIHQSLVTNLDVQILRETVSAATDAFYAARMCKNLLSHLFKLAGADGWVSKDLPSYIVLPKLEEKVRETFTYDEQQALWKSWESGCLDASMPLIMIYTGMMPGELRNLTASNIDFDKRVITGIGLKTKTRRESPIYLPDALLPVLDTMVKSKGEGPWYPKDKDCFRKKYYDALAEAGCRRLEPYCCRHTMATRLAVTESIAPQTVQRIMRWSSTDMLDRYAHPTDENIMEVVRGL